MLIDEGKRAPAFSLNDQDGKTHRLADYAGRPVVLYFYPKDDTPGCTKESCQFRDNLPKFKKSKAAVFGVSILDEASKKRFARQVRHQAAVCARDGRIHRDGPVDGFEGGRLGRLLRACSRERRTDSHHADDCRKSTHGHAFHPRGWHPQGYSAG